MTEMTDRFSVSGVLCPALDDRRIEVAVVCIEGCGTSVISEPSLLEKIDDKITGASETEVSGETVETVGEDNILDPETAKVDNIEGVCVAYDNGIHRVAVTTGSVNDAQVMRDMFGSELLIIGLFDSELSEKDSDRARYLFDIISVNGRTEVFTEFGKGFCDS